jgi:nitrate reductase alpha subunit
MQNVVLRIISRPKDKQPLPDAEEILKKVATSSKEFESAIGLARDQTIEGTQAVAYYTGTKITMVHRDVNTTMRNTELLGENLNRFATQMNAQSFELHRLISESSKAQQQLAEKEMELQQNQLDARNLLLQLIEESEK